MLGGVLGKPAGAGAVESLQESRERALERRRNGDPEE